MSVSITIDDDGRIEAVHNSGKILFECVPDSDFWEMNEDYPTDLQVAEGISLCLENITEGDGFAVRNFD